MLCDHLEREEEREGGRGKVTDYLKFLSDKNIYGCQKTLQSKCDVSLPHVYGSSECSVSLCSESVKYLCTTTRNSWLRMRRIDV